jgi:hypothetical protein
MNMNKLNANGSLVSMILSLVLAGAGCEPTPLDVNGEPVNAFRGLKADLSGEAEFEVEIRYAGGLKEADARALFARLEILPFREAAPGVEAVPADTSQADEPLDSSEPTFKVVLHALNAKAASEAYAWRAAASVQPVAPARDGAGAVAATTSALTVQLDPEVSWLSPGEKVTTARQYCRWYSFSIHVGAGFVTPCILQGAQGLADTVCGPPNTGITSIGDANPFNSHYFRGRATGYLTGGALLSYVTTCL